MDSFDKPKTVFTHGTDADEKIPRLSEQPQEWAPDKVPVCLQSLNSHDWRLICNAHNAALAAEREKLGKAEGRLRDSMSQYSALSEQLAAERETRMEETMHLSEQINKLEQQLVAANRKGEDLTVSGMAAVGSLMETQKPLVDALERVEAGTISKNEAAAILAKVKAYPLPDGPTNRGRLRDAEKTK